MVVKLDGIHYMDHPENADNSGHIIFIDVRTTLCHIMNLEERAALIQYLRYRGNYYEEIPAT